MDSVLIGVLIFYSLLGVCCLAGIVCVVSRMIARPEEEEPEAEEAENTDYVGLAVVSCCLEDC